MTPGEREAARDLARQRLKGIEEQAMQLAAASGRDCSGLLRRVRADLARLDGTAPPVRIEVQVLAGATAEEKRQAVIAAVAERLNNEGDEHAEDLD